MILFFDTYIVGRANTGSYGKKANTFYGSRAKNREEKEKLFRGLNHCYRYQDKIEIVKYTLASYSEIHWDLVVIRFDCEDEKDIPEFIKYCAKTFKKLRIINERSDTASKYVDALSELKIYGNPWIFFSPNNDHPYLNEGSVIKEYITAAEKAEELYKDHLVSIWYSHFTENINDISMKKPLWGYYSRIFKKIVMNSEKYYLVKANKLQLDSLKIIRLNYLIKIFQGVNHKGRIIRMEETPYHLSKRIREITVVPKLELCRHYDGYDFFMEKVPPLFIPEGFEKNKIKIRYGYDDYKNGWINVNPNNDKYGLSKNSSDLLCNLDQLPKFWSKKIGELDINKDFIEIKPNKYEYDLENPWSENSILKNIVKSTLRWLDPSFTIKHFYHHRFINFFKKYN